MITEKSVIEKLREYEAIFKPKFAAISAELMTTNPRIDAIEALLKEDDAEVAFLDFGDVVSNYQSVKRKTAKAKS